MIRDLGSLGDSLLFFHFLTFQVFLVTTGSC